MYASEDEIEICLRESIFGGAAIMSRLAEFYACEYVYGIFKNALSLLDLEKRLTYRPSRISLNVFVAVAMVCYCYGVKPDFFSIFAKFNGGIKSIIRIIAMDMGVGNELIIHKIYPPEKYSSTGILIKKAVRPQNKMRRFYLFLTSFP